MKLQIHLQVTTRITNEMRNLLHVQQIPQSERNLRKSLDQPSLPCHQQEEPFLQDGAE